MKIVISFLFICVIISVSGQNYNNLIEKQKFSKVLKKIEKKLSKNPNNVEDLYFLSSLQSKSITGKIYNPKMAYKNFLIGREKFHEITDPKRLEKLSEIPINNSSFNNLADSIYTAALRDASQIKTEDAYIDFLNTYNEAFEDYKNFAIDQRNILAFENAKNINSVESYNRFLETYPNAIQKNEAVTLRNTAAFKIAELENTISGYELYISSYPLANEVKKAYEQIHFLAFSESKKINTVESFQEFIDKYPNAVQINEAISNRNELAYERAKQINTSESFLNFCRNFPNSIQYNDSKINYENKLYEEKTNPNDLYSYITFVENYPDNRNNQLALEKIYSVAKSELNARALSFCIEKNYTGVNLNDQIVFLYNLTSYDGELSTLNLFSSKFPNLVNNIESYEKDLAFAQLAESIGLTTSSIIVNNGDILDQRLKREGAKTGSIQISLMWDNYNDIDLHCIDPNGEEIYYGHKNSFSGGELDVDMNAGGPNSKEPVENIYWENESAIQGKYVVYLNHYSNHGCYDCNDPTDYFVRVKYNNIIKEFRGSITKGQPKREIFTFNYNDAKFGEIELSERNVEILDKYIKGASTKELAFVALQNLIKIDIKNKDWDSAISTLKMYKDYFQENTKYNNLLELLERDFDYSVKIESMVNINGLESDEYAPFISANNKYLFFCAVKRPDNIGGEDVYISEYINNNWNQPFIESNLSKSNSNDAVMSISADGSTIITFLNGKLSYAYKTSSGWSNFEPFTDKINNCLWNGQAMISSDGNTLIFASLRENVFSNTEISNEFYHGSQSYLSDIFVSHKVGNDWSEPINLGNKINTPYTERSPFLHPDMKTLYFSSDGHGGFGKLDVYKTTRLADSCWTCWSDPINLGKEFNTEKDDWGYKISTDGHKAYFSKESGTNGNENIFEVNLPKHLRPNSVTNIEGRVLDANNEPVIANIRWEDLETNEIIGIAKTNPVDGTYFVILPSGKNYGYYIEHPDYFPRSNNIDLRNSNNNQQIILDIPVTSFDEMINNGVSVKMNNLFFEFGKSNLLNESIPELKRIAEIMNSKNLSIELSGHTDNIGKDADNQKLSEARAKSAKDFLVSIGCLPNKIEFKGYGSTRPIESNNTDEGRAKNRRVEIKFIK